MIHGAKIVREDRICAIFRLPNGRLARQGKRVPKDFPITYKERRAYVTDGLTAVIGLIKERLGCSGIEAMRYFLDARS